MRITKTVSMKNVKNICHVFNKDCGENEQIAGWDGGENWWNDKKKHNKQLFCAVVREMFVKIEE